MSLRERSEIAPWRGGRLGSRLRPCPSGHFRWAPPVPPFHVGRGRRGLGKGNLSRSTAKGSKEGEEERLDQQMRIAGASLYSPKPPRVSDVRSGPSCPSTNLARLVPREKAEGDPPAPEPRSQGHFGVAGVHVPRLAPEAGKKGQGRRTLELPSKWYDSKIMIKKVGLRRGNARNHGPDPGGGSASPLPPRQGVPVGSSPMSRAGCPFK